MANPFSKGRKYLGALFDSKIEEHADPKIQIKQAVDAAKQQHQEMAHQAAQVIGNRNQLEIRLNRKLADVEKLHGQTRQATLLADRAAAEGDAAKAADFTQAAEAFATQLVATEQEVEELKGMYAGAVQAADQASEAVKQNSVAMQQQLAEAHRLERQADQAAMQQTISASQHSMSELAAPGNVPTLDEVRDKIERRYANAIGTQELVQGSVQGRMLEVEQSTLQSTASQRLAQIRAEMGGALPSAGATPITDGKIVDAEVVSDEPVAGTKS